MNGDREHDIIIAQNTSILLYKNVGKWVLLSSIYLVAGFVSPLKEI